PAHLVVAGTAVQRSGAVGAGHGVVVGPPVEVLIDRGGNGRLVEHDRVVALVGVDLDLGDPGAGAGRLVRIDHQTRTARRQVCGGVLDGVEMEPAVVLDRDLVPLVPGLGHLHRVPAADRDG